MITKETFERLQLLAAEYGFCTDFSPNELISYPQPGLNVGSEIITAAMFAKALHGLGFVVRITYDMPFKVTVEWRDTFDREFDHGRRRGEHVLAHDQNTSCYERNQVVSVSRPRSSSV